VVARQVFCGNRDFLDILKLTREGDSGLTNSGWPDPFITRPLGRAGSLRVK